MATATARVEKSSQLPLADRLLEFYDAHRRWLLAILVLFYVAGFNGHWRLEPDSALYLSIGRNLATGQGYTYHGQAHSLAYPGWPWVLAGLFEAFGTGTLWPAHLFMLGCALGALALFYMLMLRVSGRPTAVLLTCMAGMTETVYRYAFEMRNEMPFLLGVMAFLVGFEALRPVKDARRHSPWRRWDVALLTGGFALALIMRPAAAALLGAVVVAVAWQLARLRGGWRRAMPVLGLIVAVAVGFYLLDPRRAGGAALGLYEESLVEEATARLDGLLHMAIAENLPRMMNAELAVAALGTRLGWWGLNAAASAAVLVAGIWVARVRVLWGAFFILTLGMIALVPRPEGRYLLPVLPLVAYGWWRLIAGISRRWTGWTGQAAFVLLLALWVVPNAARVVWVMLEQRQVPFLAHYRGGEYASMPELARAIQDHVDPATPVAAPLRTGRVLSYLSERTVVDRGAIAKLDPSLRRIWIVLPEKERYVSEMLIRRQLTPGPVVAQVPRGSDRPPWTLRPATRTPEGP